MLPYYTLTYLAQHCIATEIILNHFDQTSNPGELGLLMEAFNAQLACVICPGLGFTQKISFEHWTLAVSIMSHHIGHNFADVEHQIAECLGHMAYLHFAMVTTKYQHDQIDSSIGFAYACLEALALAYARFTLESKVAVQVDSYWFCHLYILSIFNYLIFDI